MKNQVSDTEKLAGTCGTVVSGLVGALDARAQQKHAEGKLTLGVPFAMVGSMIGWWASHFILFTLATAAFFGIMGAIISGIVNYRRAKKR
jgi:hypothetical protein